MITSHKNLIASLLTADIVLIVFDFHVSKDNSTIFWATSIIDSKSITYTALHIIDLAIDRIYDFDNITNVKGIFKK
jgi:hypothetical protein